MHRARRCIVFYILRVASGEQPVGPKKFSFLSESRKVTSLDVEHSPSRQVTMSFYSD